MPKFTRHVGRLTEGKFEELKEYLGNGKPFLLLVIKGIFLPNNHLFVAIVIKILIFYRLLYKIQSRNNHRGENAEKIPQFPNAEHKNNSFFKGKYSEM